MTTFVKKDNGRMEALDGCHDDLVMADAIAHFIGKKQRREWLDVKVSDNEFIEKNFNLEQSEGNGSFMTWEEF